MVKDWLYNPSEWDCHEDNVIMRIDGLYWQDAGLCTVRMIVLACWSK